MNQKSGYRVLDMGLDVGSTTVKVVLLDREEVIHQEYRRHNADVRGGLSALFDDISDKYPAVAVRARVTGSAGLGFAGLLELPFVQEVIAGTEVIRRYHPNADVVIELGGEDSKITYLRPVPEQRMNGTCAGGTGAFIDQMATLLRTDATGLNDLATRHKNLYPIASRCGVFAKSDLQPLINEGVPRADLAASIFQAVASQTVSGLACGRRIQGHVVFLGGPLRFLSELRSAFARVLADSVHTFTTPDRAQLYVAIGAGLLADSEAVPLTTLAKKLRVDAERQTETVRMRPLFLDQAERAAFADRHRGHDLPQVKIEQARGPCFLGIDAGSTTIKAVVITDRCELVFSHYAGNEGDPVSRAIDILRRVRRELPGTAHIACSCVTGYGEGLVKAALRVDGGEVETMAHYRAAEYLSPGVASVIDIGGQDMKYLRVSDGVVTSIRVNEACSSGCGSFLQTFAETMGTDIESFAQAALNSVSPVDLGSRCTVFMNSSVKQAQKEGAGIDDIAAGLSYAVVRNALYKVINLKDPAALGDKVVVQGGTFRNDAVLRAFELLTGREVVRPKPAGLMGAIGAALIARERYSPGATSSLLPLDKLESLTVDNELSICRRCQNQCRRTISTFSSGERHVSGNRCDRGADSRRTGDPLPNLYDYKYRRLFGYRRLSREKAVRGDIGIPRVLNMYENYPFWFTVFSQLGFRVVISKRSSRELFERGMDSIASENVCYPAKLAHGHLTDLVERGVHTIFYPCVTYEQCLIDGADDHFNCPVVTSYPEVVRTNVELLQQSRVRLINPFFNLAKPPVVVRVLTEALAHTGVTRAEVERAVAAGYAEDAAFRADLRAKGQETLRFLAETGTTGIVLAGRPYHVDPEVHHGIPELINGLGMAVLTEDSVIQPGLLERPIRVRDQWSYHSRLYEAAALVATRDDLELVQLNSFGCGLDAIAADQAEEILAAKHNIYTVLKIDEVSNLGAARIRLRSLAAAARERRSHTAVAGQPEPVARPTATRYPVFTEADRAAHTVVVPQMSPVHFRLLGGALRRCGYRVRILERASRSDVEVGLKFVNNDACYPAIMVVGQLVNAFRTGALDPERCSIMLVQTGGACRATNYVALLRKALADAGYGQVTVVAVSADGLERHPGFSLTPRLLHRIMQALVLGDLLQALLLRVRPYEATPGSAEALYQFWDQIAQEYLTADGRSATLGHRIGYGGLIRRIVAAFDQLALRDVPRRPLVGIVGEIFVKFHPDANNDVVRVVESEGCEAVVPGLMQFVQTALFNTRWKRRNLGSDEKAFRVKQFLGWLLEHYRDPVRRAVATTNGKFAPPPRLEELARHAGEVLSHGNQAGEGWLLTAEMLELIEDGVPNIVCAQPFACMPNHVTGKGMFRELWRRYPQANIVAVDYDPGASEVNQLNRIKLMISTARQRTG